VAEGGVTVKLGQRKNESWRSLYRRQFASGHKA
jgi:hypothetical protein